MEGAHDIRWQLHDFISSILVYKDSNVRIVDESLVKWRIDQQCFFPFFSLFCLREEEMAEEEGVYFAHLVFWLSLDSQIEQGRIEAAQEVAVVLKNIEAHKYSFTLFELEALAGLFPEQTFKEPLLFFFCISADLERGLESQVDLNCDRLRLKVGFLLLFYLEGTDYNSFLIQRDLVVLCIFAWDYISYSF